ncbi:acyltransferase family protein [Aquimarina agarilytica]|uniref:acyltransferase family protein n=1 Tax=Aquimarina agarilytica TaxID=1087449 RepID=UPI00028800CA|nr:acyltransferase family protein [Aquimarina agarilytica]
MSKKHFYRPDIDGLRAIAVMLVILFHAGFTSISGGFVGVDIFFVISGFLITSSINKQMSQGTFSFQNFYLKRIRRIIPVLVFIMFIVTIPAYFILFSDDFENYSRTIIHTILSTNNFHLWIKSNDYFAESTELIPLLHTWSLSVEEQFYIIWPPLLLLLHKKFNLKNRLLGVIVLLFLSFMLSVFLTHINMQMAYFLLPARLFEMLMGGVLAIFWYKLPEFSKIQNHIISSVGFFMMLLPALLLTQNDSFPGINALWPCLGASLFIISGKEASKMGVFNTILKIRVLVFIGLISYSMYLWHWPLLVYVKYLGFELTKPIALGVIILTILLSYLSWKFIEQPFRYRYIYDFKNTLLKVLLPSVIICVSLYGVIDHFNGFPNRFTALSEFDKDANFPSKLRRNCYRKLRIGNIEECGLGTPKDQLDGMLIGDSFANHSAAFLEVLANDAHMYFHDSAAGGYPVLADVDDITGEYRYDPEFGEKRLALAKKYEYVILAANWERFLDKKSKNYQLVLKTVGELVETGKKVIVIDPLRKTTPMDLHKMKMFKVRNIAKIKKEDLLVPFYKRPDDYIVYEFKRKFPTIKIVNLNTVMCNGNYCDYEINDNIVYRNSNHLNTSGARLLGERYLKQYGNPLKK